MWVLRGISSALKDLSFVFLISKLKTSIATLLCVFSAVEYFSFQPFKNIKSARCGGTWALVPAKTEAGKYLVFAASLVHIVSGQPGPHPKTLSQK